MSKIEYTLERAFAHNGHTLELVHSHALPGFSYLMTHTRPCGNNHTWFCKRFDRAHHIYNAQRKYIKEGLYNE